VLYRIPVRSVEHRLRYSRPQTAMGQPGDDDVDAPSGCGEKDHLKPVGLE
jgi:hypothetical protein